MTVTPEPSISAERICAVVVTFNRKALLIGCLDALLAQTHPVERILVIDNASTDGTGELLEEKGYWQDARVDYVHLPTNSGGAGGFHEGFRRAFEQGANWIWAMDDDGLPHPQALEHLLAAPAAAGLFRGPLVLAREEMDNPENNRLAFEDSVETPAGPAPLRTRADAATHARDGIIPRYVCAFNGVLIRRDAVERIGLPRKDFFIWGDEWDYVFRAHRLGIATATVTRALFWHPVNRTRRARLRVGWLEYDVPCADGALRNYLLIRNHAFLASRYRGFIPWVRHTIKYLLYHATSAGCFNSWQVLRFSLEGLSGRLQGHHQFLRGP